MKFSRAAIVVYIGLVFASGVVLGVFGHRLYTASAVSAKGQSRPNPEEFRKKALAEYKSRLNLTDDQVLKFNALMDETRARVGEVRQQMHPLYEKIHEEQKKKVLEILTPDQQVEYEKMIKEREEQQKQNGGHGPGPGGI
jgi:Spy/CpxP family protein refolding chaperone